jgi:Flp pilus assembly protein TadB
MYRLLLSLLIVALLFLTYLVIKYCIRYYSPGLKRIKAFHVKNVQEQNNKQNLSLLLLNILPNNIISLVERLIYQSGFAYSGLSVEKVISYSLILGLFGLGLSFLILLVGLANATINLVVVLFIVLLPVLSLSIYPLYLYLQKGKFNKRFIYLAPVIVSGLEDEMVYGSGNLVTAFEDVSRELPFDFRELFEDIIKSIIKSKGGIDDALNLLTYRIDHPLAHSLSLGLKIGEKTGKYKKTFRILHDDVKKTTNDMINKDTQAKGVYTSLIGIGVLIVFGILYGFPLVHDLFNSLKFNI